MTFTDSIKTCFSKYVTFSGRASRSEFWWWVLFTMAGSWILTMVDSTLFGDVTTYSGSEGVGFNASTDTPVFSGIFGLIVFLPQISVTVRRLHDTDRSGWWYWLALVPLIGIIILIVWFASKGTTGDNRFGPDPLDEGGSYSPSNIPKVGD